MEGSRLGPYQILEQLGAGGMGEVYLAEDTRLGRKVAVKVLPAQFASVPDRLARFEQEAKAAAALNHPHIAGVFDIGAESPEEGAVPVHFIVQEYLEGQPLHEALEDSIPLAKSLQLGIEIAEGLTAAHAAGVVHRDLKPANIFVTGDGHAKVLDFGLAKLVEPEVIGGGSTSPEVTGSPTVLGTVAGQMMGTAGYMAPEQVEGGEVDHRADLFAFGCVLYELATGKRSFAGRSLVETLQLLAHEQPTSLDSLNSDLPAELQRILDKCLAKEADHRYQGGRDLVVDMRKLAADLDAGRAISLRAAAAEPTAAVGAPRWQLAALASVALVTTALAGWGWMRPSQQMVPEPLRFAIADRRVTGWARSGL